MSLTFQNIYQEVQAQVQDDGATSLVLIKRAVNQGMKKFGAILNREWRVSYKTFDTVASQQYYQMPEDAIRIKKIRITIGNQVYPLTETAVESDWDYYNSTSFTSNFPQKFFVRGADEFGIWPIPSTTTITGAGELAYERRMRDMTVDDYTTGTIQLTYGSPNVVGSSTVFTANMVGRTLFATDGSADGQGYKVQSFTDTTHITLENNFGGATGSSKSYLIGECPDIPDEFHEALIDYACFRYYRRRRDKQAADDMLSTFRDSLMQCKATYSSKTSSQYIRAERRPVGYTNLNQSRQVT